ncbi:dipeptidase [Alicyclobacillus macrosporangiidus]|uniref:Membrane dipeptidase n=1 Tax=Alicyclobacillus macrosporangiidus TaxID=392015 RepID=A0A1I7JKK9_9BACL|nr:membrane dipeptidase [Alicyclobacillus macrosporangiidus]SFU85687.1 membrane dipeptidase [Alicyclobacillus macrosporangiidus]
MAGDIVNRGLRVFDLHSDLAADIAFRRACGERRVFARRHHPRLRQSGVQALIAALWVEPEYRANSVGRLLQLLGSLLADVRESADCVALVRDRTSMDKGLSEGKTALFLGVEGMTFVEQWPLLEVATGRPDPLETAIAADAHHGAGGDGGLQDSGCAVTVVDERLDERLRQSLDLLCAVGLRHAILVWGESNAIASGPGGLFRPGMRQGLTAFGRRVVQTLTARGAVVDLSHLDDASIDGVLDAVDGTVIASHSNARALCDVPRNLEDRHIREIGRRGGVIGLNSYPNFIDPGMPTLDRLVDHAVHIASLVGVEHVALGFDFTDYLPGDTFRVHPGAGLRRVEDVPRLMETFAKRGFSDGEIRQIAFDNAARVMTG